MPAFLLPVPSTSLCLCSLSHGAEQREVRKASLPLPSFIFLPLPVIFELQTSNRQSLHHYTSHCQHFPPIKLSVPCRHCISYYLTSELHILEFMCLTSPALVWASRSAVSKSCCHCEGLRSAALDSREWWQPRNKDTRLRPRGLHHFNVSHTHASHRFAAGMLAC